MPAASAAVPLDDKNILSQARARRKRLRFAADIDLELERLARRVNWLQRKAARLPLGKYRERQAPSNGRDKEAQESIRLLYLGTILSGAKSGGNIPKFPPGAGQTRHEQRAIRLLTQIQTA